MTSKITRPLLAITLALGMLAAVSAPSHAALSTTDRSAPAPVAASTEALAVAAAPSTTASDATPAPAAAAAAPVTTAAAPVNHVRKVAARPQPRRIASAPREAFASAIAPRGFGRRGGYPCH
jgi:hypothetical protein